MYPRPAILYANTPRAINVNVLGLGQSSGEDGAEPVFVIEYTDGVADWCSVQYITFTDKNENPKPLASKD